MEENQSPMPVLTEEVNSWVTSLFSTSKQREPNMNLLCMIPQCRMVYLNEGCTLMVKWHMHYLSHPDCHIFYGQRLWRMAVGFKTKFQLELLMGRPHMKLGGVGHCVAWYVWVHSSLTDFSVQWPQEVGVSTGILVLSSIWYPYRNTSQYSYV